MFVKPFLGAGKQIAISIRKRAQINFILLG
jgi:hypothetical protein